MKCKAKYIVLSVVIFLTLSLFSFPNPGNAAAKGKQLSKPPAAKSRERAITVTGMGMFREEAIRDAMRNAVERATGVFVYSVTEVKDFQLVKDRIVSASRGYVRNYRILNEKPQEGVYFLTAAVSVDEEAIRSILRNSLKAMTYEDAVKDALLVTQLQERLRRFAAMLKELSSRPLRERYIVEAAGYDIRDVGLEKVNVVMKVRVAPNPYYWDTYFKVLEQVSDCRNSGNMVYRVGDRKYCLHRDLKNRLIYPFLGVLEYYPDGVRKCRREKVVVRAPYWKWGEVCTEKVHRLIGAFHAPLFTRNCKWYGGIPGTPGYMENSTIPSSGISYFGGDNFECDISRFTGGVPEYGYIVEVPLTLTTPQDVKTLPAMEFSFRGAKLHPAPDRIDYDAYGKILGWSENRERWVICVNNCFIRLDMVFFE